MASAFPIRIRETLYRMAPEYFERRGTSQAGDTRIAVGALVITPTNSTLFVARVSSRIRISRQTWNRRGTKTYQSTADYYRVESTDYRVSEIRWSDGLVNELSRHQTRKEADQALKQIHGER